MNAKVTVSVEQLSRETACSERSVRRAIRALAALGVLSCVGVGEFVIHVDTLAAMPKVRDGA
jgi:DNA-binding GntR family transcriptional regulator